MQNNKLAQTKTSLVVLPGVPAPPLAPALVAEQTNSVEARPALGSELVRVPNPLALGRSQPHSEEETQVGKTHRSCARCSFLGGDPVNIPCEMDPVKPG